MVGAMNCLPLCCRVVHPYSLFFDCHQLVPEVMERLLGYDDVMKGWKNSSIIRCTASAAFKLCGARCWLHFSCNRLLSVQTLGICMSRVSNGAMVYLLFYVNPKVPLH
jgi:hypothetical protein